MTTNNFSIEQLDDVDKQILELLQEDAKLTIKEISTKLTTKSKLSKNQNMSQTAIRARIQKLEKNLIKKYAAIVDCRYLGYREMVLASLRVNSSQPLDKLKDEIDKIDEIKYAYIVTGEYPVFAMFKCLDHDNAMGLIEKLRNLDGVEEIKTQIVLDRIKEDHTIIIP